MTTLADAHAEPGETGRPEWGCELGYRTCHNGGTPCSARKLRRRFGDAGGFVPTLDGSYVVHP